MGSQYILIDQPTSSLGSSGFFGAIWCSDPWEDVPDDQCQYNPNTRCESLCLTLVDLVDEMKVPTCDVFDISEAESENEFCLLCLHQSVLRIWCHNMQSSVWHFAASIDLHEVFQRSSTLGSDVSLSDFGLYGALNSKLILVSANDCVCLFNVKENTATKVCQISAEDGNLLRIFPCMMIWPPAFPSELIRHVQLERQLLLEVIGADGQSSRRNNINMFSPLVAFKVNDISQKENVQRSTASVGDFGVIISDKRLGLQQLSDSVEMESPNDVLIHQSCNVVRFPGMLELLHDVLG